MMNSRFLNIVIALLICIPSAGKGWFFQSIPSPSGVNAQFVCAYIEPRGYSWCGMDHGLLRYGYQHDQRIYLADGKPGSLPGDYIYNIQRDENEDLWVFTNKGIAIYDYINDNFRTVTINDGSGAVPLVGYCKLLANDGKVYIGAEGVLYVFDTDMNLLNKLSVGTGRAFSIKTLVDRPNIESVLLFDPETGLITYSCRTGQLEFSRHQILDSYSYLFDSRGRFWRSSYNKGVECYDMNGELLASYNESNSDLTSNIINCFMENNGEIWMGTEGGGICILQPDTGHISTLTRRTDTFNSFPCYSVVNLATDGSNSVWATRSDISVVVLREVYMRSIAVSPVYEQSGRGSDEVLSFALSSLMQNRVWVGTTSSGLFYYDIDARDSEFDIRRVESVGEHTVESILALPNHKLLISFFSEGLFLFDEETYDLKPFDRPELSSLMDEIRNSPQEVNLCYDNEGNVLIMAKDVFVWDMANEKIVRQPLPSHEGHRYLYQVSKSGGRYFYCDRYLYSWNPNTYKFDFIYDNGEGNIIKSVTMDSSDNFWFATNEGIFSLKNGDSSPAQLKSELISNPQTVITDDMGRLWIATNSNVCVYLPEIENILQFSDNDGANWNRYSGRTWLYTDNHILFGGNNGFLTVDPRLSFYLTDIPDIVIQDIERNGERIPSDTQKLALKSKFKTLRIEVFAKEDNMLRTKHYMFRLKSASDDIELYSEKPVLELSILNPGTYDVYASCSMQNGQWTDPVKLLQIKSYAVWYKAWWFWALIISVVSLLVGMTYHTSKTDNEFKLALAKSEAESKADQESVKFLLNVSHELKTPLTLIISPLSRLLKTKTPEDPEYKVLTNVLRQANRISSLILTVLDSHKIKDGSATYIGEYVDYNAWMDRIVSDFDEEAESRNIKIERQYDMRIEKLEIDSRKLENVVTNMMINALKHSHDNTVITVGTVVLPGSKTIRSFVSDQGEGLGGVDMTKLFMRFYQGYAQTTGSGLGLAYANSIVEIHNGKMGAYDNADKGATFYYDLPDKSAVIKYDGPATVGMPDAAPSIIMDQQAPAASAAPAPIAEEVREAAIETVAPKSHQTPIHEYADVHDISEASILIVDDDTDLREYLLEELSEDARVAFAESNGQKALDFLRRQRVNIVVSDVMMPVMDGFELCSSIKKSPNLCDIPVILLTARVEAKSREHGLSIGADAYLPKPFDKTVLVQTINDLLKATS